MQSCFKVRGLSYLVAITALLLNSYCLGFEIEDYGMMPNTRNMTISPDGKHIAAIARVEDEDYFVVRNIDTGDIVSGARAGDIKARDVYFATNKHLILSASDTRHVFGYRGRFEASGAIVMNIETGKMKVLLNKSEGLHPAQSGLGKIVGIDPAKEVAFMPAFDLNAQRHLYRVDYNSGRGRIFRRGNSDTIDWFMGQDSKLLAREDYDNKEATQRIYSYLSGKPKKIYESERDRPLVFDAIDLDERALLYRGSTNQVFALSLNDGSITETQYSQESNRLIDTLKTDLNRKLLSITYSGLLPVESVIDPRIKDHYEFAAGHFQKSLVELSSVTDDFTKLMIRVSGQESSGAYVLFDTETQAFTAYGQEYPNVARGDIGNIATIAYKARDDRKIPSILTWPPMAKSPEQKKNMPLIVLPLGGPESYDYVRFVWWAQYLARKGYLVLQPNFRGSAGFGKKHIEAGHGQWGKTMQDDVSDGIAALVNAGYVSPDKVCIVGASYGGYAALAGGAFSPDLYRCVVAVAGVADLPRMLKDEKFDYGSHHWVIRYWQEFIGDSKKERDKLKSISPVNFANDFEAPVLLIHGKDDTVVPLRQSKLMYRALKKAGKNVELVTLKGEDHWLSKSRSRLDMLKAIDLFLDKHNPV